jgi:hypothetical protein
MFTLYYIILIHIFIDTLYNMKYILILLIMQFRRIPRHNMDP